MTNLKWHEDKKRLENRPSVAEKRIINILNKNKIEYFREVKFQGLLSNKQYSLYFDFYIPSINLIIEYDGEHHLTDIQIIENDKIKNEFCKNNKIKIKRLNKKEWLFIERIIIKLVKTNCKKAEPKKNIVPVKPVTKTVSKNYNKKKNKKKNHLQNFKSIVKAYRSI